MDIIKVNTHNDQSSLTSLIEKVIREEMKKLVQQNLIASDLPSDVVNIESESSLDAISDMPENLHETTVDSIEQSTEHVEESTAFIESVDGDSQTIVTMTTNVPEANSESIMAETNTNSENTESSETHEQNDIKLLDDENTTNLPTSDTSVGNESPTPDTLLMAVGDLLSSILGFIDNNTEGTFVHETAEVHEQEDSTTVTTDSDNENTNVPESSQQTITTEVEQEIRTTTLNSQPPDSNEVAETEQGTERNEITATPSGYDGEWNGETDTEAETEVEEANEFSTISHAFDIAKPNEVDLKIENLASAETSFMTEESGNIMPESYTETVSVDQMSSESNSDIELDTEVLEVIPELPNDEQKSSSFQDSITKVMELVKGNDGRLALEAAGSVVDSILINKHMNDDVAALEQVVYGTLKEIESNLGLSDDDANVPADSFDPVIQEREALLRQIEAEINDSVKSTNNFDYENFTPNSAKAAMQYKYQYDDDF